MSTATPAYRTLLASARAGSAEVVALRRRLHRHPEVGLELPVTQRTVLDALSGLDLAVTTGRALSSVVAVLRGARPGRTVLLRADMDALEVRETTGLTFASTRPGLMHACGHDLHTAMLVQAARLLHRVRARLAGTVVLMFQPGEEGHDGARLMMREGLIEAAGTPIDAAFAQHVISARLPSGTISTRPGVVTSGNDDLEIEITGAGGHGSAPHLARDPLPALGALLTALQSMVTRRFDVFDPVVVSIGVVRAGTRNTAIPDSARLAGTIRTFSAAARLEVATRIRQLCTDLAAAHGLSARVTIRPGYPSVLNSADYADLVRQVATELTGPDSFRPKEHPSTGSEDFSRVLDQIPGAYWYLGAAVADDPQACAYNHSGAAVFDEGVLPQGAAMYAAMALAALNR